MDPMTRALIACLFLLTAGSFLWLCFILWKPAKWGAFVDWEYAFWARRGVISPALAEKCKRLEKGRTLKWLMGATVMAGTALLLIMWLRGRGP